MNITNINVGTTSNDGTGDNLRTAGIIINNNFQTIAGELTQLINANASLALGETSTTAYRGDRGATAYNHSQITHDKAFVGLGNVDNTSDANKPISTATQTALNGKVNTNQTINGQALTGNVTLNTSSINDSPDKRYVNDSQLAMITNSGNHTALSNLNWTSSGHIGTGSTVAGFNSTGASEFLTVSGSGSVVLSSNASATNLNLTTPILGKPQSGDLENCVLDCKNGFRLTLTSATPVTTSDVTSSTIYATPYNSDLMTLYIGSKWVTRRYLEASIALSGLTTNSVYDVFAYDNNGTLTLELLSWTNATTRATAITKLNGVWTKSGDNTRRLLGTFKATSTTQTIDSHKQRLLCNVDNALKRPVFYIIPETYWIATNVANQTDDYSWGQANVGTTPNNYIDVVCSVYTVVDVSTEGLQTNSVVTNIAYGMTTFGINSTTRHDKATIGVGASSGASWSSCNSRLKTNLPAGYYKLILLDRYKDQQAYIFSRHMGGCAAIVGEVMA